MTFIRELQDAVARTAAEVGPSVVGLGRGRGGSGIVVAEDRVLTSAHNIRGEEATVSFLDGRSERGPLLAADVDRGLAVLEVPTGGAPALSWAGSEASIGTPVFALANPGGRGLRVTFGLVSATERSFRGARGRRVRPSLEHTAPLVRGSAGGPLVDAAGGLLGINALRVEGSLVLALTADADLRSRVDALARGEAPQRMRLGVAIVPGRAARRMRRAVGLPERDGLLVRQVAADGPAADAGLEEGDLIATADGQALVEVDDLFRVLDAAEPGRSLALTVVRGLDERTVSLVLADAG
ncbi:MAG: serine protease [Thermoleophilia bacterium]|nr:serine protease [Thermoleophilia bacterium]